MSEKPRRGPISGFSLWLGALLLCAALVHVLVVFMLPAIGRAVLMEEVLPADPLGPKLYTALDLPTGSPFRFDDDRADTVTCAFDLRDGAVRVGGFLDVSVWSIAVYRTTGEVAGAASHNSVQGGMLEVIVMTPSLADSLLEAGTVFPEGALVVDLPGPHGVARITALTSFEAEREQLRAMLADIACEEASFEVVAPDADSGPDGDVAPEDNDDDRPVPPPIPRPDAEG